MKLIYRIHNASTLKLVAVILSVMIGLFGLVLLINMAGEKASYSNFISGGSHATELAINRGLRQSVEEGIISRRDLRDFLSEYPIVVRTNDELEVPGRFSRTSANIFLTFREDPPYRVIIHESFHVSLYASGERNVDLHHAIMRENNWCFGGC